MDRYFVFSHCHRSYVADIERDAPENCAVVFAGESLARLTNNFVQPGNHEVVCNLSSTLVLF